MNWHFVLGDVANAAPRLALWIVALVLSSVLLKKGGGRPERFLVIGSSLMLASVLVSTPMQTVIEYLAANSSIRIGLIVSYLTWAAMLVSLPGIICLFYAVWQKFSPRSGNSSQTAP